MMNAPIRTGVEPKQMLPLARPVFLAERQRARRRLYVRALLLLPVAVALLGALLFP
jgi:hypothetical protein